MRFRGGLFACASSWEMFEVSYGMSTDVFLYASLVEYISFDL